MLCASEETWITLKIKISLSTPLHISHAMKQTNKHLVSAMFVAITILRTPGGGRSNTSRWLTVGIIECNGMILYLSVLGGKKKNIKPQTSYGDKSFALFLKIRLIQVGWLSWTQKGNKISPLMSAL